MDDRGPLAAISPLDGRYADYTEPLVPYASEAALIRARIRIEVEYLFALADLEATPLTIATERRSELRNLYESFDREDAAAVKQLETTGWRGYEATNHDVKAVEYYLREHTPDDAHPWIHFALTSEDVNNLAIRYLVRAATSDVLVPALRELRDELVDGAQAYRDLPILARTHGQPATPTTFGKEFAVYASRLGRAIAGIEQALADLRGKLGGAAGTYAAHRIAYPDVDWRTFTRTFLESLELAPEPITTQVNPCDDLATLFDAIRRANAVILDLDVDAWLYISDGYLGQSAVDTETGSSTMPHKVNPIDFENSEGNLSKANTDLGFLGSYVTNSRLQRDLSDSTVKRNIGSALGHCLIGYRKTTDGLRTVTPNKTVVAEDLASHPEVLAEAVQTILRREGHADAYEQVKALTRDERVTLDEFHSFFESLDVDAGVRAELQALTPEAYVGFAEELVDDLTGGESAEQT